MLKKALWIGGALLVIVVLGALAFGGLGTGSTADGFSLQCRTIQGARDCQFASQNVLPQRFFVDICPETIGTDKILSIRESSGAQCQFLDPVDKLPVRDGAFDCSNGAMIPAVNRLLAVSLVKQNDLFTMNVTFITPPPTPKPTRAP